MIKKDKIGVIYKLTTPDDKIYIGQTWNFKSRMYQYKSGDVHNKELLDAINAFGFDNIRIEIIDNATRQKGLNEKEKYWISNYNATKVGYNINKGGGCYTGPSRYSLSRAEKKISVGIPEAVYNEIEEYARENKLFLFEALIEAWNSYKEEVVH